jgi:hypothetical protein
METTVNLPLASAFDAEAYAGTVKSFKSACVGFENGGDRFAVPTMFGLLSGAVTVGIVTASLITVFGNPKTPAGKASDKLSCLQYAKGGDAARKTAEKVFKAFAAANGTVETEAGPVASPLAVAFRPIAVAYATGASDAPKSLRALMTALAAAEKAIADAIIPESEGEGDNEGEAETAAPVQSPLATMLGAITLRLSEATVDEISAASAEIESLSTAIVAALDRATATPDAEKIAA